MSQTPSPSAEHDPQAATPLPEVPRRTATVTVRWTLGGTPVQTVTR